MCLWPRRERKASKLRPAGDEFELPTRASSQIEADPRHYRADSLGRLLKKTVRLKKEERPQRNATSSATPQEDSARTPPKGPGPAGGPTPERKYDARWLADMLGREERRQDTFFPPPRHRAEHPRAGPPGEGAGPRVQGRPATPGQPAGRAPHEAPRRAYRARRRREARPEHLRRKTTTRPSHRANPYPAGRTGLCVKHPHQARLITSHEQGPYWPTGPTI